MTWERLNKTNRIIHFISRSGVSPSLDLRWHYCDCVARGNLLHHCQLYPDIPCPHSLLYWPATNSLFQFLFQFYSFSTWTFNSVSECKWSLKLLATNIANFLYKTYYDEYFEFYNNRLILCKRKKTSCFSTFEIIDSKDSFRQELVCFWISQSLLEGNPLMPTL